MLMIAAALCMAFYSVWSRALAKQYGAIAYAALAMTFGALVLVVLAWMRGGFAATESFGPIQWSDVGFLGIFGGALTFLLWSHALERTTPTRVAISVTVNPDCVRDLRGLCTGRADHGQSRTRPPTRCNRNFGCIPQRRKRRRSGCSDQSERPTDAPELGVRFDERQLCTLHIVDQTSRLLGRDSP